MQAMGALFPGGFASFAGNVHYHRLYFSKNCSGFGSHLCAELSLQLCSCHCHWKVYQSMTLHCLPLISRYFRSNVQIISILKFAQKCHALTQGLCQLLRALLLRNHPLFWLKTLDVSHWRELQLHLKQQILHSTSLPLLSSPASSDTTQVSAELLLWSISGALRSNPHQLEYPWDVWWWRISQKYS